MLISTSLRKHKKWRKNCSLFELFYIIRLHLHSYLYSNFHRDDDYLYKRSFLQPVSSTVHDLLPAQQRATVRLSIDYDDERL